LTYKDEFSSKNKIKLILENSSNLGNHPSYMLHETLISAYSTSGSCFIPMFKLVPNDFNIQSANSSNNSSDSQSQQQDTNAENSGEESGDESSGDPKVVSQGGALIIGRKFAEFKDLQYCKGLSLISNTTNSSSVNFMYNDEHLSLELFRIKTKIKPNFDGENLVYNISFSAIIDKSHNTILRLSSEKKQRSFRLSAQQATEEKIRNTIESTVRAGGDLMSLEDSLKHYDYRAWLKVEDNWEEVLKNAEFVYNIELNLI